MASRKKTFSTYTDDFVFFNEREKNISVGKVPRKKRYIYPSKSNKTNTDDDLRGTFEVVSPPKCKSGANKKRDVIDKWEQISEAERDDGYGRVKSYSKGIDAVIKGYDAVVNEPISAPATRKVHKKTYDPSELSEACEQTFGSGEEQGVQAGASCFKKKSMMGHSTLVASSCISGGKTRIVHRKKYDPSEINESSDQTFGPGETESVQTIPIAGVFRRVSSRETTRTECVNQAQYRKVPKKRYKPSEISEKCDQTGEKPETPPKPSSSLQGFSVVVKEKTIRKVRKKKYDPSDLSDAAEQAVPHKIKAEEKETDLTPSRSSSTKKVRWKNEESFSVTNSYGRDSDDDISDEEEILADIPPNHETFDNKNTRFVRRTPTITREIGSNS